MTSLPVADRAAAFRALGMTEQVAGAMAPTEDHYTGGEARARWAAERAGADVAVLEELGHWWMVQDPARGAEALRQLLDELG